MKYLNINRIEEGNNLENEIMLEEEIANKSVGMEKGGEISNGLFSAIRIITIILYLVMNGSIGYMVYTSTQYVSLMDKSTIRATWMVGVITILIPGLFISFLFLKKNHTVIHILKAIVQVLLIISLPFVYIIGGIASMGIPSSTTNPDHFRIWEERIDDKLEEDEFVMFPDSVPDNVIDVDYSYHYAIIFSDKCLDVEISYTYLNSEDYENEKLRMQAYHPVYREAIEDGYHVSYAIGAEESDEQNFRFGYNDEEERVTYRISYDWAN